MAEKFKIWGEIQRFTDQRQWLQNVGDHLHLPRGIHLKNDAGTSRIAADRTVWTLCGECLNSWLAVFSSSGDYSNTSLVISRGVARKHQVEHSILIHLGLSENKLPPNALGNPPFAYWNDDLHGNLLIGVIWATPFSDRRMFFHMPNHQPVLNTTSLHRIASRSWNSPGMCSNYLRRPRLLQLNFMSRCKDSCKQLQALSSDSDTT